MVTKRRRQKYKIDWLVKLTKGVQSHEVGSELRQLFGRSSTLQRSINAQLNNIEKIKKKIAESELELRSVNRRLQNEQKSLAVNPIIIYKTGRDKKYVHGKIWFYKSFGVRKGKMDEGKVKVDTRHTKKWYRFHLGRMCEMEEGYMKTQFDDYTAEDLMTNDDWKNVLLQKFYQRIYTNE